MVEFSQFSARGRRTELPLRTILCFICPWYLLILVGDSVDTKLSLSMDSPWPISANGLLCSSMLCINSRNNKYCSSGLVVILFSCNSIFSHVILSSKYCIICMCSNLVSYWVKYIELESVNAVGASVFALKITHTRLVVQCIYDTTVFGNEGLAFTYLLTFK